MSILVTETNSFQPRVLVVSDHHVLTDQLVRFFRQSDFQVEWWGREELVSAAQNQLDLSDFHRIVVVLLGKLKETSEDVVSLVEKYQSKLSIIVPYTPSILSKDEGLQKIVEQTAYLYNLGGYIHVSLPQAKTFFLQDVWYPESADFSLEQWLTSIVDPAQKTTCVSSADLFPHTLDQVWEKIQKTLFSPSKGGVFLVRGKKMSW